MAASVCSVGCDIDFNQPIALNVIVFDCRCADLSFLGKYDNAAVVIADANLVLSTKHAEALHTTQFAALDGEALIAVIELGANNGSNHLLTGCHVWSTTDNLQGLTLTYVYGANMHVVAVWMRLASQHFSHIETLQTTFDGLHFFHTIHLETCTRQSISNLLSSQGRIDIFLKPFV